MNVTRSARLSLRHMLILIVGVLTLTTVTVAISDFRASAHRVEEVKGLRRATDLTNQLFLASETLALERDVVLSRLNSNDAADAALLPDLGDVRARAENARFWAMAALEADDSAAGMRWRTRISVSAHAVATLRTEVDQVLSASSRPHSDLAARWNAAVATLLADIDGLWVDSISRYVNIDPVITQHLRYNHFLRMTFDYSGRERALIGQIIASNATATPEQAAELFRGDGVLQTSWAMSLILAQQSGLYPEIGRYYLDAKSHYDLLHSMLEETFYTPGAQDARRFPLSLPFWFELSQQARESLYSLRSASRDATLRRVDAIIAAGQRAMLWQAAILVFALGLCGLNIWAVLHRVIRPIDNVIAALSKAVRGEAVNFSEQSNSGEIGQLVDVLHAFQLKVEDARQAASDLDRSERRLRAVVDNAVDGLMTIDATGTIQSFNPACEQLFGYEVSEVVGTNVSTLMAEPHGSAHQSSLDRLIGGGAQRAAGSGGRELLARRKDGSVFPIELSISGVELPEGQCFSGIVRDITLRKQAEAALQAHTEALERSNKELDDFAYIASHDLKEPLRGIHNHSRFLLEDNEGKLDDDSIRRLNQLLYLSQRMEQLVNDLLYLSRLGRHEFAVQTTDLNEVIVDIESTLEHFLSENGAAINVPTPLPTICCDKTRITEVLRNLITNAAKYNDKSDRQIEIGVVTAKAAPDGQHLERAFYVADNGCGIAPEFHEEVFRIFKRLHGRTSETDGTGVGLTFVKKIIERHGGRIWIESEPGAGATFYFTLETPHESADDARAAA